EVASSALRLTRKYFHGPGALAAQLAILLEVLWRRWRHGEMRAPLHDIWRGTSFFAQCART
ncbi:MAG: hypothetical protein KGS61_09700, partial [Verrucomicrobia bacterium]|nr:hypothetical protein [Verrucomicrobiota bacterium]